MIDLNGKQIVLVGGSAIFAEELTAYFAAYGAHVHLLDVQTADPQTIRAAVAGLVPFDALIVAPEAVRPSPFLETSDSAWDEALGLNYERAVWLMQAAARSMIEHRRAGRIVLLSSVAAELPLAELSVLGTTLAALRATAQMAAVDLGPHGITVNLIELGWTELDAAALSSDPVDYAHLVTGTPTGRLIEADEIAGACAFLLSSAARSITGARLTLDGGYSLTRADGRTPLPPAISRL